MSMENEIVEPKQVDQEIPEGYKWTEVGVIRDDWEVYTVNELFNFLKTASNSRSELSETGEVKYVHYGDIHTKWNHFLDFKKASVPYLIEQSNTKVNFLKNGDLIIADASEDEKGVGKSIEIKNTKNDEAIAGLHTILLRAKSNVLLKGYRGYILEKPCVKTQLRRLSTGLKVFGISKGALRKIAIPIPLLKEQTAIATALSDVDNLIESLDNLIAKKRAIKQATMQQLLTGKKRLPGFEGEWEVKRLGDMGECIRGVSYDPEKDLIPYETSESIKLLRANNILEGKIVSNEVLYINNEAVSSRQALKPFDIIICMANGSKRLVGKAGFYDLKEMSSHTFGSFMGCYRANPNIVDPRFCYYLFQSQTYRNYISEILAGSSINNLKPSDIESAKFFIPGKNEQNSIANNLYDMDKEIEALEKRKEKSQQIKQGMMQELLTGKTRLNH